MHGVFEVYRPASAGRCEVTFYPELIRSAQIGGAGGGDCHVACLSSTKLSVLRPVSVCQSECSDYHWRSRRKIVVVTGLKKNTLPSDVGSRRRSQRPRRLNCRGCGLLTAAMDGYEGDKSVRTRCRIRSITYRFSVADS